MNSAGSLSTVWLFLLYHVLMYHGHPDPIILALDAPAPASLSFLMFSFTFKVIVHLAVTSSLQHHDRLTGVLVLLPVQLPSLFVIAQESDLRAVFMEWCKEDRLGLQRRAGSIGLAAELWGGHWDVHSALDPHLTGQVWLLKITPWCLKPDSS